MEQCNYLFLLFSSELLLNLRKIYLNSFACGKLDAARGRWRVIRNVYFPPPMCAPHYIHFFKGHSFGLRQEQVYEIRHYQQQYNEEEEEQTKLRWQSIERKA